MNSSLTTRSRNNVTYAAALGVAACTVFVSLPSQAAPPLNPSGAPNDRVVLIGAKLMPGARQYVNQLDESRVDEIPVLYNVTIDPDHDLKPNWNLITTELNSSCPPGYNGVIALDWEAEFFAALKGGPDHPDFQRAMNKGIALLNFVHAARPNAKVGFYGMPTAHWHVDFALLQPLFDAMSVLLPSAYMHQAKTYQENETKLHNNVALALEIGNGKPVVVFHSPRLAGGGHNLIPRDTFVQFLDSSFSVERDNRRATGVIIWDQTRRFYIRNELHYYDDEHIPEGMDLESYATQLQRHYVCAAVQGVIPSFNCNQEFPGEYFEGVVAGAPNGPTEPGGDEEPEFNGIVIEPDPVIAGGGGNENDDTDVINPVAPPTPTYIASDDTDPGVSLAPLNPLIAGSTFTNLLWTSSPWLLKESNGDVVQAARGEFGYPLPTGNQFAETVIGAGKKSILPSGKWMCKFDGQGDIVFSGDATMVQVTPGRIIFRVQPSNDGVTMTMRNVAVNDPVRNIRVMPFANAKNIAGETLHPQLVNRLRSARPETLRFASWQKIDNSPLEHWADRTTLENVSQVSETGAAYELMIELCNKLECDMWLCVPHLADDEFVEQLATLVRDTLDPNRRLIIEYSNDAMNPNLAQYEYLAEQGNELMSGLSDDEAAAKFYGRRSKEVWDIMRTVFAAAPSRLVCAYGVPGDSPAAAALVLARTGAVESADVIGVSGEVGGAELVHELDLVSNGLTNDRVVSMLIDSRVERMPKIKDVVEQVHATDKLMLVTSCGAGLLLHADGLDKQLIYKLRKAQNDPRVISIVANEVDFWTREEAQLVLSDDTPEGAP